MAKEAQPIMLTLSQFQLPHIRNRERKRERESLYVEAYREKRKEEGKCDGGKSSDEARHNFRNHST